MEINKYFYDFLCEEESKLLQRLDEIITLKRSYCDDNGENPYRYFKIQETDNYSSKTDLSEELIEEEEFQSSDESDAELKIKYELIKPHVESLSVDIEYMAINEIKNKFSLNGYRHAFFYEKLKRDHLIEATSRGKFKLFIPEPSIHISIYDYVLTLAKDTEHLKKSIWSKFNCCYATFTKAMNLLHENEIIVPGKNRYYFRFKIHNIHTGNEITNVPIIPVENKLSKPEDSIKKKRVKVRLNAIKGPPINTAQEREIPSLIKVTDNDGKDLFFKLKNSYAAFIFEITKEEKIIKTIHIDSSDANSIRAHIESIINSLKKRGKAVDIEQTKPNSYFVKLLNT